MMKYLKYMVLSAFLVQSFHGGPVLSMDKQAAKQQKQEQKAAAKQQKAAAKKQKQQQKAAAKQQKAADKAAKKQQKAAAKQNR